MASHCPPHEPLPVSARTHFDCFAHLRSNTVVVAVLIDERATLPPPSTSPRCARQVCQVFVHVPVNGVATAREAEDAGVMDIAPVHEAKD